eukprot:6987439-Pyramimonas_sp.AAC.1
MRSASFIALTGTRLRATSTSSAWSQKQGAHHFVHFGWGRCPFTNRSDGIFIGIHTRHIVPHKIFQTSSPPASAAGRGGL